MGKREIEWQKSLQGGADARRTKKSYKVDPFWGKEKLNGRSPYKVGLMQEELKSPTRWIFFGEKRKEKLYFPQVGKRIDRDEFPKGA